MFVVVKHKATSAITILTVQWAESSPYLCYGNFQSGNWPWQEMGFWHPQVSLCPAGHGYYIQMHIPHQRKAQMPTCGAWKRGEKRAARFSMKMDRTRPAYIEIISSVFIAEFEPIQFSVSNVNAWVHMCELGGQKIPLTKNKNHTVTEQPSDTILTDLIRPEERKSSQGQSRQDLPQVIWDTSVPMSSRTRLGKSSLLVEPWPSWPHEPSPKVNKPPSCQRVNIASVVIWDGHTQHSHTQILCRNTPDAMCQVVEYNFSFICAINAYLGLFIHMQQIVTAQQKCCPDTKH